MLDVIPLVTAVDRLADRLRSMPRSTLRRGAAAAGQTLADELSRRAQQLESPTTRPLALPAVEDFAVGDQLAVAGHDLAEALRVVGRRRQLDEALELIAEHGRSVR